MQQQKSVFTIGIYDPKVDDGWPWHYQYEHGDYLSPKHRKCGMERAAEFDTEDDARAFYFDWKHYKSFKFELIEKRYWTTVPDPVYPPEHPRSILKSIIENESYAVKNIASLWFYGEDVKKFYSAPTLKKHRITLLKYDIDINTPLSDHLKITPIYPAEFQPKTPILTIVK